MAYCAVARIPHVSLLTSHIPPEMIRWARAGAADWSVSAQRAHWPPWRGLRTLYPHDPACHLIEVFTPLPHGQWSDMLREKAARQE